jgi:hypothetical protein
MLSDYGPVLVNWHFMSYLATQRTHCEEVSVSTRFYSETT